MSGKNDYGAGHWSSNKVWERRRRAFDVVKIEKRILEEYENFVFQGYTRDEIAYMGVCLQRWAIRQCKGPANLVPG